VTAIRVGIAGAGVFGTYHAQKAAASVNAELVGVFDLDPARASRLAEGFGAHGFSDFATLLQDCEAVIIATPATTHEALVRQALLARRHVLVEKPLSLSGASARVLVEQARAGGLVLQVGHQERFVARAMGVLDIAEMPLRMESVRINPPAPGGRAGDVSVIWDLMIHDLDLAACIFGRQFAKVEASGRVAHSRHIDHAEATVRYADGAQAVLTASRDSDRRARSMRLVYESGEIFVDFLTRQIVNSTPYSVKVDIAGDLPDPLGAADEGFFRACLGRHESPVPGHGAVAAVEMAEAVEAAALAVALAR
jgi:predicted dehydrogenase